MELEVSVLGKELQKLLPRVEMVIQSRVIVFYNDNNNSYNNNSNNINNNKTTILFKICT